MPAWIYESPDGGKTVTRRPWANYDENYKEIRVRINQLPNNEREEIWTTRNAAHDIVENAFMEAMIREQNPTVMEAWEHYQVLLNLAKPLYKE
jgi:hypothetical protein